MRGNFDGQVTDVNGNALPKEQVKKYFLLNPNDKTSLEFQDPEVDHTLVLHMNADGGLTMQGKDFSQADTGNTRTYIMASWSANGDYNAEGHDIKNVNSLSANRLVINGTDITDSLGGAVDVSGKADTSYVDEALGTKADKKDLSDLGDKVNVKADKTYVDGALGTKADKKDLSDLGDKVDGKADKADVEKLGQNVSELKANKADKSYVDAAVKNATEGIATNANVANKADKDLGNLSEAGKNVIKETMKDDLAAKADKTYVDGALDKKANAADVYTKTDTDKKIEDSLTDVNKAVAGKADANASNIDVAAYTKELNTGKVEDGNKGLVSGGVVWNAIKDVKNNTGAGWVKVNGDTVAIASDAGATKVSVAGLKGDRVLTGVKTDEKDASSAANVGYVNSTAISLTDSMNAMNSKLSDDIKNAGAVGAALAGLHHLDYDPDNKLDVAVAAGNYRGKSATAMGLFYQPNEMMMVSAGATIGADDNAYNVGLSFKVGKGQTGLTTSKAAMSQEIKELKAAKKESDQKMAAQDEEIRALKEQVAMLVKEMKLSNTVEKDMKK